MKPISEDREGQEGGQVPSLEQLKGRALSLLTRREHSRFELQNKLLEQGGQADLIDAVLDELVQRKLQSDERFAEVFVRSRVGRGYGPLVIQQELKQRGVAVEKISEAIAHSGFDWFEQAQGVRNRRFGDALPQSPRDMARQLRFLQYRGFGGQPLMKLLRGIDLDG